MRINSISVYQNQNLTKRNVVRNSNIQKSAPRNVKNNENVSFKGFMGKVAGGLLGGGIAGLCAVAAMATPAGWIAAATLLASEAGGAAIGGAIGDKIEGKDDNE